MGDRIQRALDGELPRQQLSSAEQAQLEAAEETLGQVLHALPNDDQDLVPGVMARVAALEAARAPARPSGAARVRTALAWAWAPRAVTLRPAWVLAAAMLLAVVLLREPAPAAAPGTPATPTLVLVHFQLEAPAAADVRLAGDFTDWQPTHVMSRSAGGIWSVVVPLTPGVHEYAFVVDGSEWRPDPAAPAVADGFGGVNSRVAVLTPDVGTS